jgi:plasmid stability protein
VRTTIDLPDALLKHLKARAALEGRTLRDLVVDLVEKGLNAREAVDPQQRMQARPLVGAVSAAPGPTEVLGGAGLQALVNLDDDERSFQLMAKR